MEPTKSQPQARERRRVVDFFAREVGNMLGRGPPIAVGWEEKESRQA